MVLPKLLTLAEDPAKATGPARVLDFGRVTFIDIVGEPDIANIHQVRGVFDRCAALESQGPVVVSLVRITHFDSQLIHALTNLSTIMESQQRRLLLVVPATHYGRRIFTLVGLDPRIELADTDADALKQVGAAAPEHVTSVNLVTYQQQQP